MHALAASAGAAHALLAGDFNATPGRRGAGSRGVARGSERAGMAGGEGRALCWPQPRTRALVLGPLVPPRPQSPPKPSTVPSNHPHSPSHRPSVPSILPPSPQSTTNTKTPALHRQPPHPPAILYSAVYEFVAGGALDLTPLDRRAMSGQLEGGAAAGVTADAASGVVR